MAETQPTCRVALSISHHILCAGGYSLPFARLSARCLRLAVSAAGAPEFRVYIHCDAFPRATYPEMVAWLRDEPGVIVTYGWFGMRHDERNPVNWHQRMINRTCEMMRSEDVIAMVDADLFLADGRWFDVLPRALEDNVFGLSWGMRANRTIQISETRHEAMKTCLFALHPQLHLALNEQRSNTDMNAVRKLQREFPGARIETGEGLDTLVGVSLRAQALGWQIPDIEVGIGAAHIGGFSHMDRKKLSEGGSNVRLDRWLQRLRLMERVLRVFETLDWSDRVDRDLRRRVTEMRALVDADAELATRAREARLNADERHFPSVCGLLGVANVD